MLCMLVKDGTINLDTAALKIGMSVEELQKKVNEYNFNS